MDQLLEIFVPEVSPTPTTIQPPETAAGEVLIFRCPVSSEAVEVINEAEDGNVDKICVSFKVKF